MTTLDTLEAALRAVPMLTWTGQVKTLDGDWVGPVTLDVADYPALVAAALECVRGQLPTDLVVEDNRTDLWNAGYNARGRDVARRLGL